MILMFVVKISEVMIQLLICHEIYNLPEIFYNLDVLASSRFNSGV
jgi:hypothetical protein